MDVHHPAFELANEVGGQNTHETRQTQDVGLGRKDRLQKGRLKPGAVAAKGAVIDGGGRNTKGGRFGQPARRGIVRGNQNRHARVRRGRHVAQQRQHV